MIRFSVVIPTFNSSSYIQATIKSVLDQTYLPYEIIIIDDCSDDKDQLYKIITDINSNINIRYIQSFKKNNASYSRNTGILNAKGNYIAFLDSDDLWLETKLEEVKNYIDILEDTPSVIFHQAELISPCGSKSTIRPSKYGGHEIPKYLFINRGFIQTSCIIVSKLIEVYFDEKLPRHQDFQYCIDLSALYEFKFISMPLTKYTSHSKAGLKSKESFNYSKLWIESNKHKIDRESYYAFRTVNLTSKHILHGQFFKALSNFLGNYLKLRFATKVEILRALFKK